MPRPRKNDPGPLIRPLVEQFAAEVAAAIERATIDRVLVVIGTDGGGSSAARRRPKATCYYPGCKNVAAPRFGMFCAALHKGLSKSEKEKYRAQRR